LSEIPPPRTSSVVRGWSVNSLANRNWLDVLAAVTPLLVFVLVYGPAVGQGFVSDDFGWIKESQLHSTADVLRVFQSNHGFYRPLVSLSFGINHLFSGTDPRLYGLTNLVLAGLSALLAALVFRKLGLTPAMAGFGAAVWLLNFHGINMALLWISGRTALLLIVASLGAALAILSNRIGLAVLCVAAALFSKEEAVALPFILLAWLGVLGKYRTHVERRQLIILGAGLVADLTLYAVLRSHAGALTASTAPPYYRFSAEPVLIARNIAEYADRACTYAAAICLLAWFLLRAHGRSYRVRRSVALPALAWYIGGYSLTTLLPVRSSLYACFPSIAVALLAAEFCSSLWNEAEPHKRRRALVAVTLIPLVCIPIYASRNHRWTDLGRFSQTTLNGVEPYVRSAAPETWVVLIDDRSRRVNLQSAFGTLIGDALDLRMGRHVKVWVEPPLTNAGLAGFAAPCDECDRITLKVSDAGVSPLFKRDPSAQDQQRRARLEDEAGRGRLFRNRVPVEIH